MTFVPAKTWAVSLPVQRVAEALAEDASEVARLGLVCRCFRERTWVDGGLQTPRMKLLPHTSLATIRQLRFGALRDITVYESSAIFLPGPDGLARHLFPSAPCLECLRLQLHGEYLQACWAPTLTDIATSLGHVEGNRKAGVAQCRIPPLRSLDIDGRLFPSEASDALGFIVKTCSTSLHQIRIRFSDTIGDTPFSDEQLWEGLVHAERLEVLHLIGLRTSQETCTGLTRVFTEHASSIYSFGLGGLTVAALLRPSTTIQHEHAHIAGTPIPPELAKEISSLIAAGSQLQLKTLVLCAITAPDLLSPLAVGFGECAKKLAALLAAAVFLAPSVETLNLSGNSGVVNQALPDLPAELLMDISIDSFDTGHDALLEILRASHSLTSLDVSGSSLHLGNVLSAPSSLAKRALHLVDFKIAGCSLEVTDAAAYVVHQRQACEVMMSLMKFEHIRHLDLGRMALASNSVMRRAVSALLQRCAPSLLSLSGAYPLTIAANGFSSMFATGTCREPLAKNLESLNLCLLVESGSDVAGNAAFVDVLKANTRTLRSLQIRGLSRLAPLGDAYGVVLASALQTAQLAQLTLNLCGLAANTARYLATTVAAAGLAHLTHISLSYNLLAIDAGELIDALRIRNRLREVRLRRCDLPAELGPSLGKLVIALPNLLLLDIAGNERFCAKGAHTLLKAALKEWGRVGNETTTALPACIDLRECRVDHVGADADAVELSGRPIPRQLGRFKILLDGAISDPIGE